MKEEEEAEEDYCDGGDDDGDDCPTLNFSGSPARNRRRKCLR